MSYRIKIDSTKCIHCRSCEASCSFGRYKAVAPARARIRTVSNESEGLAVPVVCEQCEDAPCAQVCPKGAITRNAKTGAYVIDNKLCIGCKLCAWACPYGNITYDEANQQILKCDLCDGNPRCVAACPTGALSFEGAPGKRRSTGSPEKPIFDFSKIVHSDTLSGWKGRYLLINLSDQTYEVKRTDMNLAEKFIGQRGLGERILLDHITPDTGPLSDENAIVLSTGPLTGIWGVSSNHFSVITKSPLTGTIAAAQSGGYFGSEIKYAGYDMIVIKGACKKPTYIYINGDNVIFSSASHIWGKNVHEATQTIISETDENAKVCCIGPAGENLVRFASVTNDLYWEASRADMGAVFGYKMLKAIAVRGIGEVHVADFENYKKMVNYMQDLLEEEGVSYMSAEDNSDLARIINEAGAMPIKNFGDISGEWNYVKSISQENVHNLFLKNRACFSCNIGCRMVSQLKDEVTQDLGEGPDYDALWSFGAQCGVSNLNTINKATFMCNILGLGTVSTGSTIGCAMEMFEKGIIDLDDTNGLELRFGNDDALLQAIIAIAYRRGFGAKLADGSFRLSTEYGHPELSMSTKKVEFFGIDPRASEIVALSYATSNRGGCHAWGDMNVAENAAERFFKPQHGEIVDSVIYAQDYTSCIDSLGMCQYPALFFDEDELAELLSLAVGLLFTGEDLLAAGERIWNMERDFNLSAGITSKDDTLPPRFFEEPLKTGAAKGKTVNLMGMLPAYYEQRGWDEMGVPKNETLKRLKL